MDLNRQVVRRSTLAEHGLEVELRDTTIEQRLGMMWQLAVNAWAMKGDDVAEHEFQRHVVRIERRGR